MQFSSAIFHKIIRCGHISEILPSPVSVVNRAAMYKAQRK